ncbi:MAG: hypothetical protein HY738_16995 [Bacteroidia bacterium]|nr:hypothetical protein [Bacteroidia bacterium]
MKIIKFTKAVTKSGEDDDGFVSSFIEYDKDGRVICAVSYASAGEIESKVTYRYDEKGDLLEEINYSPEDEISEKFTYKRDENSKVCEVYAEYSDGSQSVKKYIRDPDGKTLTIVSWSEDNEFEGRECYKFNQQQKLIEKCVYNEREKIEEAVYLEYDENNQLIKEKDYSGNMIFKTETMYKYDEKGNLISRISVNPKRELIEKLTFKYDEKGNQIEQKYGELYMIKREYNDSGNITREERFNALGITEMFIENIYDENGLLLEERRLASTIKYEHEFFVDYK